jgi:hypothetical protein
VITAKQANAISVLIRVIREKITSALCAIHSAEPFWRRFQEVFRYLLKTATAVFIVAMAFLNVAIVFMKYCFVALKKLLKVASSSQYKRRLRWRYHLIPKTYCHFIYYWLWYYRGTILARDSNRHFFGVLALCFCTAIINFSLSESIVDAVNP